MTCSLQNTIVNGERIPVVVNGEAIPYEALVAEMQNHPAATPIASWKLASFALTVRQLLLDEANRIELVPEPLSDEQGRRETDDEALIRQVVEREVITPKADEETCRTYYEANKQRFRSADIFEVSHILIAARRDDAKTYVQARQQTAAIIDVLRDNPENFDDYARQVSDCPSSAQSGNLGQITKGQTTQDFEAAFLGMKAGEISDAPVETDYGVHIIRLTRRIDGRVMPLDAVHTQIANYLGDAVERTATSQYIARLAARADISGVEMPSAQDLRVF